RFAGRCRRGCPRPGRRSSPPSWGRGLGRARAGSDRQWYTASRRSVVRLASRAGSIRPRLLLLSRQHARSCHSSIPVVRGCPKVQDGGWHPKRGHGRWTVFGRKPAKTHRELMMDELAESYEHFRQAASHMAGGAAERLAPRYEKARGVASKRMSAARGAVNPLVQQMREGAASARMTIDVRPQKKQKKRRRWPRLMGLLAAGTAVGAAGAMSMRRRRAAEWEEQEAIPPIEYGERAGTEEQKAAEKVAAGATSRAEAASQKAGKMAESREGSGATSGRPDSTS